MQEALDILYVEDNLGDLELLHEAFVDLHLSHRVHHVKDGEEALAYLRRDPPFADAPWPDLLLLDLNLPRKTGFELLVDLAHDKRFRALDIIVFTTTAREEDVFEAAGDLPVRFVTKPVEYEHFLSLVERLLPAA